MIAGLLRRVAPTHFAVSYKQQLDGSFNLYEARRGRGKSYAMAHWARVAVRANRPVYANFWLSRHFLAYIHLQAGHSPNLAAALEWTARNVHQVESWDEVMVAYNALILLDEVNRLFDSQDLAKDVKAPKVVFEWLQQSRKHGNTIVFAAQSMDWLSPRVRQLFDRLWRAKKVLDKRGRIQEFYAYGSDPWAKGLGAAAQREADFKMRLPFDESIYRLYNTLEIIKAFDNHSRWERFSDVEAHMLAAGLKPAPAPVIERPPLPDWWDAARVAAHSDRQGASTGASASLALGPPLPPEPLPPVRFFATVPNRKRAPSLARESTHGTGNRPPLPDDPTTTGLKVVSSEAT
jgi:Zonular occludens toxin (Zot)